MRRVLLVFFVVLALAGVGFWVATAPQTFRLVKGGSAAEPTRAANVENGHRLFFAGGCASCHAVPEQDDKARLGGGLALPSPFGTFHVPNISPHERDGIGAWTVADFIRAMREGVAPDGRHYYPAFPYTSYQRMSADDLNDLFAFLRTLPAMEGRVRDHDLPFPFNIRRGVGLWKLAFLDGQVFRPDPQRSASWNNGAYLVEGPGHCAECHSPRNMFGAIIDSQRLAGGASPDGRGMTPNLTPHKNGLLGWTQDELAEVLRTGETPLFDTVDGAMQDVIKNTAQLPPEDRAAVAEYLLSLPPQEGAGPKPES